MGIRKKEHRRKVEKRNARIQHEKNLMNKLYKEAMKISVDELKAKIASAESGKVDTDLVNEVTDEVVEEIIEETLPEQEN